MRAVFARKLFGLVCFQPVRDKRWFVSRTEKRRMEAKKSARSMKMETTGTIKTDKVVGTEKTRKE